METSFLNDLVKPLSLVAAFFPRGAGVRSSPCEGR